MVDPGGYVVYTCKPSWSVEFGLCNLSLQFSLTHVVVAESSFG